MQPPEGTPNQAEALAARLSELGTLVDEWTRAALDDAIQPPAEAFAGMLGYHLGWRDQRLAWVSLPPPSGKKLRPGLALLVCEATCGEIQPARDAAVAVELVHNFSLVHDDIQDHSPFRRHRPTVWRLWDTEQAINVGDALFALAQVVLARAGTARAAAMAGALNTACLRLVEGQFLDLELQRGALPLTLDAYEAMIARKTGALFAGACRLGAMAGGAPGAAQDAYAEYGLQLGIAFQEQDDLLGVWGRASETGKPEAADVLARKKGLPAALALARADAPDWLREAYTTAPGDMPGPVAERVVQHFDALGLRAEVERSVLDRYTRALGALCAAGGREPASTLLAAVGGMLLARRA